MKKLYIMPKTIIVNVELQQMIAGSPAGMSTDTYQGFDGDAADNEVGESRRGSFWDDDEY